MKMDSVRFVVDACPPDWALPAALVALAALLIILLIVTLWPLEPDAIRIEPDPMAQPFGDQPELPAAGKRQ